MDNKTFVHVLQIIKEPRQVTEDDLLLLSDFLEQPLEKKHLQKFNLSTTTDGDSKEVLHTSSLYRILKARCV